MTMKNELQNIINKYPVISKIQDERIFDINVDEKGFYIQELCDTWFYCDLKQEELKQLSDFFLECYLLSKNLFVEGE